jgi:FdrA protein
VTRGAAGEVIRSAEVRHVEVRRGIYRDSVRLMEISSALTRQPGVSGALIAMATELNLDMLAGMGFDAPDGAGPNDLLVAVSAADEQAITAALAHLERELTSERTGPAVAAGSGGLASGVRPRTTGAAARGLEAPAVALISTPGRYAFVEAMDALDAGLPVMIFSDNVPVEQEVRLKQAALGRDLLVMGPDCGTAVIGGVGLGFANVVRPGPVGIVAASGTGAQQVMSLLGAAGVGISHCLGVGGRDLSAAVAGASALTALAALDADLSTELIVLIGKSPAPEVATAITEYATRLRTPVLIAPLGPGRPDLTAVVEEVLARLGVNVPRWPSWPAAAPARRGPAEEKEGGWLRGLFSGGTLCAEAMAIAAEALGPIGSNTPIRPEWSVGPDTEGHVMIDLGDDAYTVGRPHPMIDYGPRLDRLAAEVADPRCRVLLLDVVLGHGAHPDPAAELAPAVRAGLAGREAPLTVVASLVGTAEDPQGLDRQATALRDAGAWVYLSNAAAARHAARTAAGGPR